MKITIELTSINEVLELKRWIADFHAPILCGSIEDIGLDFRTTACLKAEGIQTIEQLIAYTENDLLKTPNFGRKSLSLLKDALAVRGLTLKVSEM